MHSEGVAESGSPAATPPRMWVRRLAAAASGLLLAAAFPGLSAPGLAWVALVPLILASRGLRVRAGFGLGWIAGTLFFLGSMYWLWRVTVPGLVILAVYCGLYPGLFAAFISAWDRRVTLTTGRGNVYLVLAGSTLWAGLELLRSSLFTGFTWNTLGVSQFANLSLIQIAEFTGVYGVSFVLVAANLALAGVLARYHGWIRRGQRVKYHPEVLAATVLVAGCMAFGLSRLRSEPAAGRVLRVGCVQPDISQYAKWDDAFEAHIRSRLQELSSLTLIAGRDLDLLLWPETALPDEFRYSEKSRDLVFNLVSQGVPLLVGTIDFARSVDERGSVSAEWFNTAMLIDREGRYAGRYDKRHLVMFGEYVPGWRWMPPWVSTLSPLSENFSPGTDPAVFRQIPDAPFGVLICFEDTIPGLARDSVNAGARLLVNQTNDGWFEPSRASWQHAAHGVFRSVENRVPTVRATNSGVTCSITPAGRIQDVLAAADASLEVRFPGFKTMGVVVPGAGYAPTFYTRHGDLFGWLCAVPAGAWILFLLSARLHKRC